MTCYSSLTRRLHNHGPPSKCIAKTVHRIIPSEGRVVVIQTTVFLLQASKKLASTYAILVQK